METPQEQLHADKFIIYSQEEAFQHMTQMRSSQEQELYIRIDEALFHLWDPNCLSIDDQFREEYLTYLPQVFDLLMSSEDGTELVDYLLFIEESQYDVKKGDNLALERACRLVNALLAAKESLS